MGFVGQFTVQAMVVSILLVDEAVAARVVPVIRHWRHQLHQFVGGEVECPPVVAQHSLDRLTNEIEEHLANISAIVT